MSTKEIILAVAEAFNKGNIDEIANSFAEDGQWNMLGDKVYSGRENIKNMFGAQAEMNVATVTMDHVITDGDTGVIDGYIECSGKEGGKMMKMFYCDIYELQDGKVKKMTSYVVDKKE